MIRRGMIRLDHSNGKKNHTRFLARSRVAMQVRMKKYPWNELLSHRRNMSKQKSKLVGKNSQKM